MIGSRRYCSDYSEVPQWCLRWLIWLRYQDSNLNKQNQNLLCYHYTISQYRGTAPDPSPPD